MKLTSFLLLLLGLGALQSCDFLEDEEDRTSITCNNNNLGECYQGIPFAESENEARSMCTESGGAFSTGSNCQFNDERLSDGFCSLGDYRMYFYSPQYSETQEAKDKCRDVYNQNWVSTIPGL